jgi:hypothetical protein
VGAAVSAAPDDDLFCRRLMGGPWGELEAVPPYYTVDGDDTPVEFSSPLIDCGCPIREAMVYHDRSTCGDPVAARFNWYADLPSAAAVDDEAGRS